MLSTPKLTAFLMAAVFIECSLPDRERGSAGVLSSLTYSYGWLAGPIH